MGSMSFSKYSYSMLNSTTNYTQNILTIKGIDFFCGGAFFLLKQLLFLKTKFWNYQITWYISPTALTCRVSIICSFHTICAPL